MKCDIFSKKVEKVKKIYYNVSIIDKYAHFYGKQVNL